MAPGISVIIPAYNVQNHIHVTLGSLLSQGGEGFEIIVVNDGSTDGTADVARRLLLESRFGDYKIIDKENGGVSSARNRGIEEAAGRYVMFLDGDDYVAGGWLDAVREHAGGAWDVVCWGYDQVKEDGSVTLSYFDRYERGLGGMSGIEALQNVICKRSMRVWTGSALYRRDFLLENGLDFTQGCASGEDQEFVYKALSRAQRLMFISSTLSYYLQRDDSISNSYDIRRFDAIAAMERVHEYILASESADIRGVADDFKTRNIIENYLYNLKSCLVNSKDRSIVRLLEQIDAQYPQLNSKMKRIMRSHRGSDRRLKVKIRLFLISPRAYFALVNFGYRLSGILDALRI